MNKILPLFLCMASFFALAEEEPSSFEFDSPLWLEAINDTLLLSASQDNNGDNYATIAASHDLNDTWRIFGEYTTLSTWELGVGYSFYTTHLYNEIYVKMAGYDNEVLFQNPFGYIGIFTAGSITDNIVWYTNFEFGYSQDELTFAEGQYSQDMKSYELNKTLGLSYDVMSWLNLSYAFNHNNDLKKIGQNDISDTIIYNELTATFNVWILQPSVTYTFGDYDLVEFGIAFDF